METVEINREKIDRFARNIGYMLSRERDADGSIEPSGIEMLDDLIPKYFQIYYADYNEDCGKMGDLLVQYCVEGDKNMVALILNMGSYFKTKEIGGQVLKEIIEYLTSDDYGAEAWDIVFYLLEDGEGDKKDKYSKNYLSEPWICLDSLARDSFRGIIWGCPLEVLKHLVELGLDLFKDDYNSFEMATEAGRVDVLNFLVEQNGEDVIDYNRLLKISVKYGHLECIKYLLDKGADIRNHNYALFREMAKFEESLENIPFLLDLVPEAISRLVDPIFREVLNGFCTNISVCKYLIDQGAHIPITDVSILERIRKRNPKYIASLIELGVMTE